MALIRVIIVPVLLIRIALRYSVPLIFSVDIDMRTIFSWTRSSSIAIDSLAFPS